MRALRVVLATGLLFGVMSSAALAADAKAKPPLVHLRWNLVARGVTSVAASDRYLAYTTSTGMTLVDQQTHASSELDFSPCSYTQAPYPFLGGPWVAGCSDAEGRLHLYDSAGNYWQTVPSSGCQPFCGPIAVGSHWIELVDINCYPPHCVGTKLLENIATGEIKTDPVQPHVNFREDLDSPTGTGPLCPPLRYPARIDGSVGQLEPGRLTMLGQFALTAFPRGDQLERCHSTRRLWLNGEGLGGSQMVLWSRDWYGRSPNHGLLLPSLRRFKFEIPRRFHPGHEDILGITISGRTIYVLTESHVLWAARVPRIR